MAERRFLLVPNAISVRPLPRSDENRTTRLPCFSATETHNREVKNCDKKKTELCRKSRRVSQPGFGC